MKTAVIKTFILLIVLLTATAFPYKMCIRDRYIPEERTKEYYKKRPCPKIVCMAADILEEYLDEHGYLTGKGI